MGDVDSTGIPHGDSMVFFQQIRLGTLIPYPGAGEYLLLTRDLPSSSVFLEIVVPQTKQNNSVPLEKCPLLNDFGPQKNDLRSQPIGRHI